ncbi:MAG TPA: APC family permease [Terriglobales bacterium]|jgi:basic amino acid/polyamine antiporter, APA family|nr:APC family permease [Terriglobales bacterium]
MTHLARKLRVVDYFTLGWGTMVGVGWLVVMDDWLGRGGPLGGVLGFAIGGALLLPIGYIYGQLVAAMPDAAGEIAYTAKVFPQTVSYATGWMMFLAYFIVCPWEAVALGRIAAFIFPRLDSLEIYRVAGRPVYLPHLALGLGLTALLTMLNYRGVRLSATFQNWTTFAVLGLFVIFVSFGAAHGSPHNFPPLFSHTPFISVLLVLQIVPYFMTGFESVAKCAEEANPEFQSGGFFRAIVLAIVVGVLFYTIVIAAVAWASPWKSLPGGAFSTAVAFERALHARWIVSVILSAALLSLFKVFNGNFVASSRLLFALGRRGMVEPRLGRVHPTNQTPAVAVVWVGIATAAIMLAGEAILVPITEVGSVASALGWMAACASYYRMRPLPLRRAVAVIGVLVALGMVLMKALPFIPGHFSMYEWIAFAAWVGLGWAARRKLATTVQAASSTE